MARISAPVSRREANRRRSLQHVQAILGELQRPADPLSQEAVLAMHAQLAATPTDPQASLPLATPSPERSS